MGGCVCGLGLFSGSSVTTDRLVPHPIVAEAGAGARASRAGAAWAAAAAGRVRRHTRLHPDDDGATIVRSADFSSFSFIL